MGREIAEALGIVVKNSDGHLQCQGGDVVTWLFGHLLEMCQPHEYDPDMKKWRFETLPFVPGDWKLKPKPESKKQFGIVRDLIKKADSIVHAGDIDREGQLLVDELLEYVGCKKKAQRILLSSLDAASVKKALADLRNNADYQPLRDAALARSRADFLVGINCTRAMTLTAQNQGYDGVLSLGRVQTPTLALVVARDLEIENFKPQNFLMPKIEVEHPAGTFWATWAPGEDQAGLDSENRLIDARIAEELRTRAQGQKGILADYSATKKTKAPPLPHSLATLQKAASARFGLSAADTLAAAQGLYEAKVTTYPRSECQYLAEEQHADAATILANLKREFPQLGSCDASRKSKAWDTSKVAEHHGIIPTGASPAKCSAAEQKVFSLILQGYAQQFLPAMEYLAQKAVVDLAGERWEATGRTISNKGWTAYGDNSDDDEADDPSLPQMNSGDSVRAASAVVEQRQTKPPARFTDGTLIEAMSAIHRFVSDPKIKQKLKETSGIGTPATRANIIETLFSRDYLRRAKKQIISTDVGRNLIRVSPRLLTDPGITALWEQALSEIEHGRQAADTFVDYQIKLLPTMIEQIRAAKFDTKVVGEQQSCPACGGVLKRWQSKKKKDFFFWSCCAKCGAPSLMDENGKPGKPFGSS